MKLRTGQEESLKQRKKRKRAETVGDKKKGFGEGGVDQRECWLFHLMGDWRHIGCSYL